MMGSNIKKSICPLCRKLEILDSKDHVPAKSFYNKPTSSNKQFEKPYILTCSNCNNERSRDDEFAKIHIAHWANNLKKGHSAQAISKMPSIYRGLRRKNFAGLKHYMISCLETSYIYTPLYNIICGKTTWVRYRRSSDGGLILNPTNKAMLRVENTISTYIKGLFRWKTGCVLHPNYDSYSIAERRINNLLKNLDNQSSTNITKDITDLEMLGERVIIKENDFEFTVIFDITNTNMSNWTLTFYNEAKFFGCTLPIA